MFIENPDAFKSWLTSILEPLCDADPAALAKYVYALVKKDKPLNELRDGMVDQLDVFLQHETKPFVEMLFKSLEKQEHLKTVEKDSSPVPQPPEPVPEPEPQPNDNEEQTPIEMEDSSPAQPAARARSPPPAAAPLPKNRLVVRQGNAARVGAQAPRPTHPHHEQTLVKVLPLTELLEEPVDLPRRRDRRDGPAHERRRRRSRSWERRLAGRPPHMRRHPRDDERRHERDDERRHERSVSPRLRGRNRSPPPMHASPIRSRSRSPVPLRDLHERDRDRLRMPREMERDRMSRDRDHRDRLSRSRDRERSRDRSRDRSRGSLSPRSGDRVDHNDAYKRRCRDFDEKGYCMRGDLCEWDHGTDPVVLEDAALSRALIPPQPPVPGTLPASEYNPLAPDIWCGGFPPYGPPLMPPHPSHVPHPPQPPRELIPIPRVRSEMPPSMPPMVPMPRLPPPRKHFDYNRLGPARPPLPSYAANCSLEVKKVPRGLNDITHLNNHFSKFGKIVNIQVCYEGDPEAALITFSSPMEANIAHKSTEAVLNNRFIKVFWHNPEGQQNKQENAPPVQQAKQNNGTNNNQPFVSLNKVLINRDNMKATADNKQQAEKEKAQAKEQSNGKEDSQPAEPKEAAKPPEPSKQVKVMEMHRRAQALLETQLQQQVLLIQKLESGNVTGPQKTALLEAINSAQEGIEKLRKELVAYNNTIRQMQAAKKPKTREEAQKEILDAELDMFTKQQEGQDVTDLAKKIADLRRQMALQYPSHHMPRRPHPRGRYNTAMRYTRGGITAKPPGSTTVDHRPKALLVSGFEPDELQALVTHFSQFGEVTGKEVNLAVPELVLQYKARVQAEQAMLRGKNYNDRTLCITWATTSKPAVSAATSQNGETTDLAKEPQTPSSLSEDTLLRFDEEEEEDSEDRSWRR